MNSNHQIHFLWRWPLYHDAPRLYSCCSWQNDPGYCSSVERVFSSSGQFSDIKANKKSKQEWMYSASWCVSFINLLTNFDILFFYYEIHWYLFLSLFSKAVLSIFSQPTEYPIVTSLLNRVSGSLRHIDVTVRFIYLPKWHVTFYGGKSEIQRKATDKNRHISDIIGKRSIPEKNIDWWELFYKNDGIINVWVSVYYESVVAVHVP